jgi:hypothetical protein
MKLLDDALVQLYNESMVEYGERLKALMRVRPGQAVR